MAAGTCRPTPYSRRSPARWTHAPGKFQTFLGNIPAKLRPTGAIVELQTLCLECDCEGGGLRTIEMALEVLL